MTGRVLTIHLVEGSANGLQTAEIDNWIGKVFVAPRTDLPTLLQQPEMKGLGAYVLIGDDPNQINRNIIYVGQGNVANRLTQHSSDATKAFWDNKTLVVVAKDNSLNTADCLYLERRLIELASNAKSSTLTNGQYPALPTMATTDKIRVENFLAQIQVLLPVLNINFFSLPPILPKLVSFPVIPLVNSQPAFPTGMHSATFLVPTSTISTTQFTMTVKGIIAEADLVDSLFIVRRGSQANPIEGVLGNGYKALRQQHRNNGNLIDDAVSGNWVFSQDVPFTSPSAAAVIISGNSINGPQAWKVKGTQQTYGQWLQNQVTAVPVVITTP